MWTPSGKLGESGLLRVAQMWSDVYSAPHHPGVTVQRPKAKGAGGGVPRLSVGRMCVVFSSTDKCLVTALRAPQS